MPLPPKVEKRVYFTVNLRIDEASGSDPLITLNYPQSIENKLLVKILAMLKEYYTIQNCTIQNKVNEGCYRLDVYLSIVIDLLGMEEVVESIKKEAKDFDGEFDENLLQKYQSCLAGMLEKMREDVPPNLKETFFEEIIKEKIIREIKSSFNRQKDTLDLRFKFYLN